MTYPLRMAAQLASVSEQQLRYLIRVGAIAAQRVGGKMVLSFGEVARLKQLSATRRRREPDPAQLSLPLELPSAQVVSLDDARRQAPLAAAPTVDVAIARSGERRAGDAPPALTPVDAEDHAESANLLATLHEQRHRTQAIALARHLRIQFPHSALVQFNCGVVLHANRLHAEAVAPYEAALALDSSYVEAHRYLHECYEELGQLQLAIRHGSAWLRHTGP